MKGHQVTKAKHEDSARLAELVNSAYRGDYAKQGWTTESDLIDGTRTDEAALAELIKKDDTTLLKYEENGSILGCVELVLQRPSLYLGMLTVEPRLQGKGIGKILLKAAEEFAKENGCSTVVMTVITIRTELLDWYKRHGYADTGKRKPFAFTDPRFGKPKEPLEFMVMEKKLSDRTG